MTHATCFNFRYNSEGVGKDGQGKIDENDESDNEVSFYENVPNNNSNDPILRPRNRQGLRRSSGGSENDRVRYVVSHKICDSLDKRNYLYVKYFDLSRNKPDPIPKGRGCHTT